MARNNGTIRHLSLILLRSPLKRCLFWRSFQDWLEQSTLLPPAFLDVSRQILWATPAVSTTRRHNSPESCWIFSIGRKNTFQISNINCMHSSTRIFSMKLISSIFFRNSKQSRINGIEIQQLREWRDGIKIILDGFRIEFERLVSAVFQQIKCQT